MRNSFPSITQPNTPKKSCVSAIIYAASVFTWNALLIKWVTGSGRRGVQSTINLAEFRYIAARNASPEAADAYIADLRRMGVEEYPVDSLWKRVSEVKANYTVALGDAYALAAAEAVGGTLLVGADDDYDVFEDHEVFGDLIERFRI